MRKFLSSHPINRTSRPAKNRCWVMTPFDLYMLAFCSSLISLYYRHLDCFGHYQPSHHHHPPTVRYEGNQPLLSWMSSLSVPSVELTGLLFRLTVRIFQCNFTRMSIFRFASVVGCLQSDVARIIGSAHSTISVLELHLFYNFAAHQSYDVFALSSLMHSCSFRCRTLPICSVILAN